jgi:Predicted membrane protein
MSLSQHYGILRVVHGRTPQSVNASQHRYALRWFPEEPYVCLLTRKEATIGRALSNDCILLDPAVSREHVRLTLDEGGWRVYNLTEQNALYVNEQAVPAGGYVPLHSLDFLSLGNTILQFIAPATSDSLFLTTPTATPQDLDGQMALLEANIYTQATPATPVVTAAECEALAIAATPLLSTGESAATSSGVKSYADEAAANLHDSLHRSELSITTKEKVFGGVITLCLAFMHSLHAHRRAVFIGALSCFLVLGTCIFLLLSNTLGISTLVADKPLTLLSVLSIPVIAALGISILVSFVDRYEREPWYLRLASFCWGAIIAVPPTVFIEQSLEFFRPLLLGSSNSNTLNALFTGLNAGFTEETVKGLGVMLLFIVLRDEFDNVTDGIVYGALIGAGFAMVENILYFAGSPKTFAFLFVSRIVLGWLNHSTFTICFGAALGYIRHTRVRWQHIVVPLLGYLVAVSLHTIFDFINSFANALALNNPDNVNIVRLSMLASVGDYLLLLMVQVVIIFVLLRSLAHEENIIREFLASEVSGGTVYVEEYALLQRSFLRARVERSVLWRYGLRQWWRVRALYQTEIGLAFRKWHVSMGDKPKLGYLQPEDAYRQRILRLRKAILAAEERA